MRLLGIDIETTGLDKDENEITEIAWVLMETPLKGAKPLDMQTHLCQTTKGVPDHITDLTGITEAMTVEFGKHLEWIMAELSQICDDHPPDYIVAHNGSFFDKPFMEKAAKGMPAPYFWEVPWLDTKELIHPETFHRSTHLNHLAMEHGFMNPFPHAGLMDVLTMMRILGEYDLEAFIERCRTPWVVIAMESDYHQRHIPKGLGYSWENVGDMNFPKMWVKRIKENEFEQEEANSPLPIQIIAK